MNKQREYAPVGRRLPEPDRRWLVVMIDELGPPAIAEMVGVTRGTLASAAAGFAVSATTAARVREAREEFVPILKHRSPLIERLEAYG